MIKATVLNNRRYGPVKQWQHLFYEGRHSAVTLGDEWPDYSALAASLGCVCLQATTICGSSRDDQGIPRHRGRPVVVEFVVDDEEMLWPMVAAGGNNDEIHMGPETVIGDVAHRPRII